MREYPVRTPVPANAVPLTAGVRPPPGKVALEQNMPGHRRFKPPLFPDAGWDSPVLANGDKFYDDYLVRYWRAPFLRDGTPVDGYPGLQERGWVDPGPYRANVARSRATAAEEALFERRMQFILAEVMKARPLQNLHGASLSPVMTINGYGEQYGKAGDGVMRGEIVLQLNMIAPNVGQTERMPDGTIKSTYYGPTIRIRLNPDHIDCAGPLNVTATGASCVRSNAKVALAGAKLKAWPGSDPRLSLEGGYADRKPSTFIRLLFVQHDRRSNGAAELDRGRMHPHDPLGRAIGVLNTVDWEGLLARANALT